MSKKLHKVLARFQTGIDQRFDIVDTELLGVKERVADLEAEKRAVFGRLDALERQLHVICATPPAGSDPIREEQFNAAPDGTKLVVRCAEMVTKTAIIAKLKPWLD